MPNLEFQIKKFVDLNADELYSCLKLRTDVFVVEQECPYPELDNHDQTSTHVLAYYNSILVAYARVVPAGQLYSQLSIGRVVVHQEYRKHGFGRALFTKAIESCSNQSANHEIKIQAQEYLLDFYKSFGFKEISKSYLEDGIPHKDMLLTTNFSHQS